MLNSKALAAAKADKPNRRAKAWSLKACRAPHMDAARRAVRTALENGLLSRPDTCERCGDRPECMKDGRSSIQAHHHDYNRPLDVQWLCYRCHRDETPKPASESAPAVKLTASDAEEIRLLIKLGTATVKGLGRRFGVDPKTIRRVLHGETWTRSVGEPAQ